MFRFLNVIFSALLLPLAIGCGAGGGGGIGVTPVNPSLTVSPLGMTVAADGSSAFTLDFQQATNGVAAINQPFSILVTGNPSGVQVTPSSGVLDAQGRGQATVTATSPGRYEVIVSAGTSLGSQTLTEIGRVFLDFSAVLPPPPVGLSMPTSFQSPQNLGISGAKLFGLTGYQLGGKQFFVVSGRDSHRIYVVELVSGALVLRSDVAVGDTPKSVASFEINNGNVLVAVVSFGGGNNDLHTFQADSSGQLTLITAANTQVTSANSVAFLGSTGDLVIGGQNGNGPSIFRLTNNQYSIDTTSFLPSGVDPRSTAVTVGDFDGMGGRDDIAFFNEQSTTAQLSLNASTLVSLPALGGVNYCVPFDLNNSGRQEILWGSSSGTLSVSFVGTQSKDDVALGTGVTRGVAAFGPAVAGVLRDEGKVVILENLTANNSQNATLVSALEVTNLSSPEAVLLGDYNNDGVIDMIVTVAGSSELRLYFGQ